jgi:hypothetical protein
MRNITITLPDDVAQRLRIEAAKADKSVSKFVGELIEGRIGRRRTQAEAMAAFLSAPLLDLTDENGRLPTREELYDDALLPRFERADLQPRSPLRRKEGDRAPVARKARLG